MSIEKLAKESEIPDNWEEAFDAAEAVRVAKLDAETATIVKEMMQELELERQYEGTDLGLQKYKASLPYLELKEYRHNRYLMSPHSQRILDLMETTMMQQNPEKWSMLFNKICFKPTDNESPTSLKKMSEVSEKEYQNCISGGSEVGMFIDVINNDIRFHFQYICLKRFVIPRKFFKKILPFGAIVVVLPIQLTELNLVDVFFSMFVVNKPQHTLLTEQQLALEEFKKRTGFSFWNKSAPSFIPSRNLLLSEIH